MKLELDGKEVKIVLLAYVEQKWPGSFNSVDIDAQYGSFRSVTFTHEEPKPADAE